MRRRDPAIASFLNHEAAHCPHPAGFVRAGIRSHGIRAAADVEMTLFYYTSEVIRGTG